MPPREIIKAMHRANPHGMGMCTPTMSYKGMSIKALLRKLESRTKNEPCLLHFRLATHGSIRRANCHPFHDRATDTWFMHNGILDITPRGDMTDSETAFREILLPTIEEHGLDSDLTRYTIKQVMGFSRFAFMQGYNVRLFGDYTMRHGCWFSNLRFLQYLNF